MMAAFRVHMRGRARARQVHASLAHEFDMECMRMQGDCTSDPPTKLPLAKHRPPQCVIYHTAFVFVIEDRSSNLWFDSLFLRGARTDLREPSFYGGILCSGDGSQYRVTNSTFQGDGGPQRGISTEKGCRLYAAGMAPLRACGRVHIFCGASASCTPFCGG